MEEHVSAHHHPGQLILGHMFVHRFVPNHSAGTQNRHLIYNGNDFLQLMGDENDGFSVVTHVAQRLEKRLCLLGRQYGGGLVKNQNLYAHVNGREDFHPLLLSHGELPDF